jgi:hypothetical protein
MSCPQSPRKHFRWHSWKRILHYPAMLSDGAGGCWAGHLVGHCTQCGVLKDLGIWAAGEDLRMKDGKAWQYMRDARDSEMEEIRIRSNHRPVAELADALA